MCSNHFTEKNFDPMNIKHEYDPTQKYKLDPYNMKIYTKEQYVQDCLGGLPNVDLLEEQWEKLPDAFIKPVPVADAPMPPIRSQYHDIALDIKNAKVNPSDKAMKLADKMFSAARYQGDGDSLDARSAAFLIDELIPAYDSELDTLKHIKRVSTLLSEAGMELIRRGNIHDESKLSGVEKEGFDKWTPLLSGAKYGSDEYKNFLTELKVSLEHHYKHNSHHPEHYEAGIEGMNLFDLLEMILDWIAATERTKDGNIYTSIKYNKDRFHMSEQLVSIFNNTADWLDCVRPDDK